MKTSLRQRAINMLARREMSRYELERKLRPYCEEHDNLSKLLDELTNAHWQSDERFAESFIYSKSRKQGNLRIQHSLELHGIDTQLIQELLPSHDAQLNTAIQVLQKRFKSAPENINDKQKQVRFLAYRGFDNDIIYAAIEQAWLPEQNNDTIQD